MKMKTCNCSLNDYCPVHGPDGLFDESCYELAEDFLPSDTSEKLKNKLAYCIQIAIEDWLETAGIESD